MPPAAGGFGVRSPNGRTHPSGPLHRWSALLLIRWPPGRFFAGCHTPEAPDSEFPGGRVRIRFIFSGSFLGCSALHTAARNPFDACRRGTFCMNRATRMNDRSPRTPYGRFRRFPEGPRFPPPGREGREPPKAFRGRQPVGRQEPSTCPAAGGVLAPGHRHPGAARSQGVR
jgi:hypothetical protein